MKSSKTESSTEMGCICIIELLRGAAETDARVPRVTGSRSEIDGRGDAAATGDDSGVVTGAGDTGDIGAVG